jgi:hypothetical protein
MPVRSGQAARRSIRDSTQTKMIFQVDDENKEPSSSASIEPRPWKERYRWLGVMMMAAFAGFAPAPPPPKPPRELSEYAQIAEDPDKLKLDPDLHFLHKALNEDESSMNA